MKMNKTLIIAILLILALYYFSPSQKPQTTSKSTQTDHQPSTIPNQPDKSLVQSPEDFDKSLETTLDNLIASMKNLNQQI
jgi:hypothetical protein